MHFVDISNKITEMLEETVKVNTIHNELIRNNEFVLIWRWIYALKDWGFTTWTVLDVISSILEKKWEPMSTHDVRTLRSTGPEGHALLGSCWPMSCAKYFFAYISRY